MSYPTEENYTKSFSEWWDGSYRNGCHDHIAEQAAYSAWCEASSRARREVEELIQIAGDLSGYFIRFPEQVPDEEFVEVCNGSLRVLHEWLKRNGRNPLQERAEGGLHP